MYGQTKSHISGINDTDRATFRIDDIHGARIPIGHVDFAAVWTGGYIERSISKQIQRSGNTIRLRVDHRSSRSIHHIYPGVLLGYIDGARCGVNRDAARPVGNRQRAADGVCRRVNDGEAVVVQAGDVGKGSSRLRSCKLHIRAVRGSGQAGRIGAHVIGRIQGQPRDGAYECSRSRAVVCATIRRGGIDGFAPADALCGYAEFSFRDDVAAAGDCGRKRAQSRRGGNLRRGIDRREVLNDADDWSAGSRNRRRREGVARQCRRPYIYRTVANDGAVIAGAVGDGISGQAAHRNAAQRLSAEGDRTADSEDSRIHRQRNRGR